MQCRAAGVDSVSHAIRLTKLSVIGSDDNFLLDSTNSASSFFEQNTMGNDFGPLFFLMINDYMLVLVMRLLFYCFADDNQLKTFSSFCKNMKTDLHVLSTCDVLLIDIKHQASLFLGKNTTSFLKFSTDLGLEHASNLKLNFHARSELQ